MASIGALKHLCIYGVARVCASRTAAMNLWTLTNIQHVLLFSMSCIVSHTSGVLMRTSNSFPLWSFCIGDSSLLCIICLAAPAMDCFALRDGWFMLVHDLVCLICFSLLPDPSTSTWLYFFHCNTSRKFPPCWTQRTLLISPSAQYFVNREGKLNKLFLTTDSFQPLEINLFRFHSYGSFMNNL